LAALERLTERRATREQGVDPRFELRNELIALCELDRIRKCLEAVERIVADLGERQSAAAPTQQPRGFPIRRLSGDLPAGGRWAHSPHRCRSGVVAGGLRRRGRRLGAEGMPHRMEQRGALHQRVQRIRCQRVELVIRRQDIMPSVVDLDVRLGIADHVKVLVRKVGGNDTRHQRLDFRNRFVLNDRIFTTNMTFSVAFLGTTLASYVIPR